MRKITTAVLSVFVFMAFYGCIPYEKLVSYKVAASNVQDTVTIRNAPDVRIQPGDVLRIKVYGPDERTAAPFNLTPTATGDDYVSVEAIQLSGYLVDKNGAIDFPVLGTLRLKGHTISEAKNMIREKLLMHLKDPVVNVRLLNFQVTVSGEVRNPGSFFVINERITIPEALSLAGDLTDYANRNNVLLVREADGVRSKHRINLQSTTLFQSPVFYLKQNDFLYVEPIKAKTGAVQDQSNKTLPVITAAATLIAVVVSILRN